jgi:hypothetical protein
MLQPTAPSHGQVPVSHHTFGYLETDKQAKLAQDELWYRSHAHVQKNPPSSRVFGTDRTDGTAPDVDHHHAQNPDWKPGTDCQLMGSPQLESIGARFEVFCTVVQYAVQRLTLHPQSLSWPQKTL